MDETKFNIIAGEKKYPNKKSYAREEITEKLDQAYNSGNAKEYLRWYKIYEEQYGFADIIC